MACIWNSSTMDFIPMVAPLIMPALPCAVVSALLSRPPCLEHGLQSQPTIPSENLDQNTKLRHYLQPHLVSVGQVPEGVLQEHQPTQYHLHLVALQTSSMKRKARPRPAGSPSLQDGHCCGCSIQFPSCPSTRYWNPEM